MKIVYFIILISILSGCNDFTLPGIKAPSRDSLAQDSLAPGLKKDTVSLVLPSAPPVQDTLPGQIAVGKIHPEAVVAYAETLINTPYKYASTDPAEGFDCSGFITYVFSHFGIKVPRSSIDFTHVGREIGRGQAKRGDIILFTGTDSTEKFVGHMGIVVSNQNGDLQFIHSSSGKAHGVTISPLKGYYESRFVKVTRIFSSL